MRIDNSWKSISVNMNNETLTEWNHLAFTYENETVTIFWNGQEVASGVLPGTFSPNSNNPMYFGRDGSTRFFAGMLDDVQIWKRALTESEIQGLINP
ncbi:MAG: LamG domain-containing protein [Puniceicoccaceae bacterium]|nr:MAG: LamG domain-containing protein [Puniceicoccaceae bacterium]